MGYTHYWDTPRLEDDGVWQEIIVGVQNILICTGIPVGSPDGEGDAPHINNDYIGFNGVGEDACESFLIRRSGQGWQFCKTARRPYDDVVTAVLLLLEHHLPGQFQISSDGSWEEWTQGRELFARTFPEWEVPVLQLQ